MDILFFDKRPMVLFGLIILSGIYSATGSNTICVIIFSVLIIAGAYIGKTRIKYIIAALVMGIVFFFYGNIIENSFDKQYMEFNNKTCSVYCTVVSVDLHTPEYTLITVKPKGCMLRKIKVYLMNNKYELIQGDRLSLTGTLRKPAGSTNPGGYDARKVLYSDGIAAYIFVDSFDCTVSEEFTAGHVIGLLHKSITGVCRELLGDENGNILAGMMLGDKSALDPVVKDNFRNSGLSHTMAVSGAHVAYILVPLIFVFSIFGIDRRKYNKWLIGVLLFFALLTGFTPSVARAALTACLMLTAGIFSNETDPLNSLAVSAVILMSINPFCIYDAGYILSYISVASILIFYSPLAAITGKSPVMKMLAITLAVQIGILPATAKLFYTVQIFSVLSNLLIFPIRAVLAVSGWIMYFLSIVSMDFARIFSFLVGILIESISSVAELFGSGSLASINIPYIPPWLVFVYAAGMYLFFNMKKKRLVPVFTVVCVVSLYMLFFAVPKNTFVFFDSGQADCFLIKTDKKSDIVIDTGKYALNNSLAHFCGDYIDMIFLTHSHQDHIGGLESILKRFRVGIVFIPGCYGAQMTGVRAICDKYNVRCVGLTTGDRLKADGYEILVLNPYDVDNLSLNDTSIVLKLSYGNNSLLYCGDIEMPGEISVLGSGYDLKADILKVPHHGAAGSAYKEFFEAVSPKMAIISCGVNYFGHPSEEILDLLKSYETFRTDKNGAIIIKLKKDRYKLTTCMNQTTRK